jgi:hypothetical protein
MKRKKYNGVLGFQLDVLEFSDFMSISDKDRSLGYLKLGLENIIIYEYYDNYILMKRRKCLQIKDDYKIRN